MRPVSDSSPATLRHVAPHPAALVYRPRRQCLGVRRMRLTPASLRAGPHFHMRAFAQRHETLSLVAHAAALTLDHFVVTGDTVVSFAERGLL